MKSFVATVIATGMLALVAGVVAQTATISFSRCWSRNAPRATFVSLNPDFVFSLAHQVSF